MRNTSSTLVLASFVLMSAAAGTSMSTAGCGGGGGGGSGGSGGSGGGATCFDYSTFDGTTPAVGFQADVLPLFQRSCGISGNCHGDAGKPFENRPYLGPNKDTTATATDIQQIIDGLVGVSAFYEPGMSLVEAGDAEQSFLMYKVDFQLSCATLECAANDDCGTNMPQGNKDPLAQTERDTIRRWIIQGAQNN